ncbi:hypothetical protein Hanom_Chr12g01121721 [Helianthus anomalus]
MTRDVRGKPLINLDRRHKTSGADNRSCLVLLLLQISGYSAGCGADQLSVKI